MAKEVWHRVDSGSFEKQGKEYKYVVEQDKNKPINTSSKNVRMRIIKEKPVVRRIRTRYDPTISVIGDEGAVAPAFFGFDMKVLKPSIFTFAIFNYVLFFTVDFIFFKGAYNLALFALIPSISFGFMPSISSEAVSWFAKIAMVATVLLILYIPFIYRFFQKWKLYKKLKKEGIDYVDMHGMTGN